jgi:hypothetical protein
MNMQSVLAQMAPHQPAVEMADPYIWELWCKRTRQSRYQLLRNVRDLDEAKQIVRAALPNQQFWILAIGPWDQLVCMDFSLRPRFGREPECRCMGATIWFVDATKLGGSRS